VVEKADVEEALHWYQDAQIRKRAQSMRGEMREIYEGLKACQGSQEDNKTDDGEAEANDGEKPPKPWPQFDRHQRLHIVLTQSLFVLGGLILNTLKFYYSISASILSDCDFVTYCWLWSNITSVDQIARANHNYASIRISRLWVSRSANAMFDKATSFAAMS